MSSSLLHILRILLCIAAQALVFNNVELHRLIAPQVFIYCILFLPLHFNRFALLISAFVIGFAMDSFANTAGMYMMACTLIAFVRPFIIRFLHQEPEEIFVTQQFYHLSFSFFAYYIVSMSMIFHLVIGLLEAFTFTNFFFSLLYSLLSGLTGALIMLIFRYAFAWYNPSS